VGIPFAPLDGCARGGRLGACGLDHRRIEINPHHVPRGADPLRRESRHDPGPTGDIQHTFPRVQGGAGQELLRPRGKQRGDHVAFVRLRGMATDLPLL
jgi:hypothetical protein